MKSVDGLYDLAQQMVDSVFSFGEIGFQETMWKYEQRAATTSLVATGGRLLFGGDANGRFRAFDQETGKVLWEVNLGSAVTGYPIAYASGGRQYIAVSTGGSLATGGLNGLTPELRPGASNTLFVFALPAN